MKNNYTYISNQNQELLCAICKSYLKNPQILINCGHMFCRDCLKGSIKLWKSQCPIDNTPFTNRQVYDSPKYVADSCDKLCVRCNDCSWEGREIDFSSHSCRSKNYEIGRGDTMGEDTNDIDDNLKDEDVTGEDENACGFCDRTFVDNEKLMKHKCKYQFLLEEINSLRQSNEYLKLKIKHDNENLKNENKRLQNHIYGMSADFTELCKEVLSMKLEIRRLNNGNRVFMQSQQVMQSFLQKQFVENDSISLSTNSSSNSKL